MQLPIRQRTVDEEVSTGRIQRQIERMSRMPCACAWRSVEFVAPQYCPESKLSVGYRRMLSSLQCTSRGVIVRDAPGVNTSCPNTALCNVVANGSRDLSRGRLVVAKCPATNAEGYLWRLGILRRRQAQTCRRRRFVLAVRCLHCLDPGPER
jgi:hypothetical protein